MLRIELWLFTNIIFENFFLRASALTFLGVMLRLWLFTKIFSEKKNLVKSQSSNLSKVKATALTLYKNIF